VIIPGGVVIIAMHEVPSLHVLERTYDVTISVYEGVVMVMWRGTPQVGSLKRLACYLQAVCDRHGKFSVIISIESMHTTPPGTEARQENARLTHRFEEECLGIATILEGTQIRHSLVRFVMATVQLMSSSRIPQTIFDTTMEATVWTAGLHGTMSSMDLGAALKQSRRTLEANPGPYAAVVAQAAVVAAQTDEPSTASKKAR
jgi:hypothetical protein